MARYIQVINRIKSKGSVAEAVTRVASDIVPDGIRLIISFTGSEGIPAFTVTGIFTSGKIAGRIKVSIRKILFLR
jgi:hypothetical protein